MIYKDFVNKINWPNKKNLFPEKKKKNYGITITSNITLNLKYSR